MTNNEPGFEIGKQIWPSIASTGGNATETEISAIQQLIIEFADYLAHALDNKGITRFAFPLFRPFNAVFGITKEYILIIISPLAGGIATLRFMNWQDAPAINIEQANSMVLQQLGWRENTAFSIPGILLYENTSSRQPRLQGLANDLAERIKGELQRLKHKAKMQPIFRTSIEELDVDPTLCFVLMPFKPEFDRIYQDQIRLAIEEVGLKALRADEVFSPTPIVEDIWTYIARSRIIVADVTDKNPNVFYELGLAHAIGKPVIILSQHKEDVPFDIAYIRYILYTDNADGWQKLKENLVSALSSLAN